MIRPFSLKLVFAAIALAMAVVVEGQELIVCPAASMGAGNIMSVSADDGISAVNPAQMSYARGLSVAATAAMPYSLSALKQAELRAVYGFKPVNVAASVVRSGDSNSAYTVAGGGLSRQFGMWAMGMEYYAVCHSLPYSQSFWSSFSRVGVTVVPTAQWKVSVALHNVERSAIDYEYSSFEIEPRAFMGVRWAASEYFTVMAEAEKGWNSDIVGKAALAVTPYTNLTASVGFASEGSTLSAGASYRMGMVSIAVGLAHHQQLGLSSAATVTVHNVLGGK